MNRPPTSIIIQVIAIPFIVAGVVAVFLIMDGRSEAAQYGAVMPLAYLLGSISWGYMLLQWKMGVDVREYGSGRTGMSNVLRTGGTKVAAVVLIDGAEANRMRFEFEPLLLVAAALLIASLVRRLRRPGDAVVGA